MSWFRRKKAIENLNESLAVYFKEHANSCIAPPPYGKTYGCYGCGYRSKALISNIKECKYCKPKDEAYNAAGPGSHFDVKVEEKEMKCCRHCDYALVAWGPFVGHTMEVSSDCFRCKPKHECKSCDIQIDIKLTYCVSCAGGKKEESKNVDLICEYCRMVWQGDLWDYHKVYLKCTCKPKKEEPKMKEYKCEYAGCDSAAEIWCLCDKKKDRAYCRACHKEHFSRYEITEVIKEVNVKEFDLRPFEIKHPNAQVFYSFEYVDTEDMDKKTKGFATSSDAQPTINRGFLEDCVDKEWLLKVKRVFYNQGYIFEQDRAIWNFKDIEIGCFFKATGRNVGSSICIKTHNERLVWLYDYKMRSNSQDRFLGAYGKYEKVPYESLEASEYKITNVYKCDELYKHFMIEELKS